MSECAPVLTMYSTGEEDPQDLHLNYVLFWFYY
jgi:hypothetical protein